jgi:hypothetical protein
MKATADMIDTVNTLKYPEHQSQWLDVMGVVRWQATGALEGESAVANATDTDTDALSSIDANAAQVSAPIDAPTSTAALPDALDVPAAVAAADYCVLGAAALTAQEAYLLAGMMLSVGAERAVYAYVADDLLESVLETGLAALPQVTMYALSAAHWRGLNDIPNTVALVALGAAVYETQWVLPTLEELMAEPLKKREAWQVLKKIKLSKA